MREVKDWNGSRMYDELESSDVIRAYRTKETPINRSRDGYGRKLPTNIMIDCTDGKSRRVYVCCFSNTGTAYVQYKGHPFVTCDDAIEGKI